MTISGSSTGSAGAVSGNVTWAPRYVSATFVSTGTVGSRRAGERLYGVHWIVARTLDVVSLGSRDGLRGDRLRMRGSAVVTGRNRHRYAFSSGICFIDEYPLV